MNDINEQALEQAAGWVVRLNDAEVTEADFADWQAWLNRAPAHAQAFHEIQDAWRRSASVPRTCIAGQIAGENRARRFVPSARLRLRYALPVAAVICAAVIGLAYWLPQPEVVQTATDELRSLRLPDGSRVSLGPETRFELDFSSQQRVLKMQSGEAFFEVARDAVRPFSVDTPAGRVTAVGTAFTVHAADNRLAVSVTEGAVRIDPEGTIVSAGNRLVRDRTETKVRPLASEEEALAWQQGRLEYQGEPLRVVVADINRYSPVKVRIDDPVLRERRYTGTVFPDTLEVWLTSLEGVFPVRVVTVGADRHLQPVAD
jgi:transmembrane sensor